MGCTRGGAHVEYLLILVLGAIGLIIAFERFRAKSNIVVKNQAKTVVAMDAPDPAAVIGLLGGYDTYSESFCDGDVCTWPGVKCFAAGTLVDTENGDRPIESIQIGERVWSRNETTKDVGLHRVTRRFVNHDKYVVDLKLGHDALHTETITVTPNHPFWVEGQGWTPAEALATNAGWSPEGPLSIATTFERTETTTVYNLEVEGDHTYFVGHSHALVHNANPPTGSPGTPPQCPGQQPAPTYTGPQWGQIGEAKGAQQAEADGLHDLVAQPWPDINPMRRARADDIGLSGFDDVRVDSDGHVYIVEYKGNTAQLGAGPPPQMSEQWVERKLQEIRNWLNDPRNAAKGAYNQVEMAYKLITDAYDEGRLYGRLYRTVPDSTPGTDGVGPTTAEEGWAYGAGAPTQPINCGGGAPNPPCP